MSAELFQDLLSNAWAIVLVVLFFGGSIFVHELGHFLAARWCGLHVERFSIGFGPAICSWRGKDGVEYRLSWLPIGGYVTLPQLAAMSEIEGESSIDVADLPPVTYGRKMFVLVAGAACNILFALALGTVIWFAGQPTSSPAASTTVGYVAPTLALENGTAVPSPAHEAGLKVGDVIRAIDGTEVTEWIDILQAIRIGSGRTATDAPKTVFTVERDGATQEITVYPQLAGPDQFRRVGIDSGYELLIHEVTPGGIAAQAGFHAGDEIRTFNGQRVLNVAAYFDAIARQKDLPLTAVVRRGDAEVTLSIPPRLTDDGLLGMALTTGYSLSHPTPFKQLTNHVLSTVRTLSSLINPHSDIDLTKMSGPVGIVRILHSAAQVSLITVIMFTILINVNLAIFNLLPIPVVDGGQMLFATIGKLRGRALPANFVMATQSTFVLLLFGMMLYVTVFGDLRRLVRDLRTEKPSASAPADAAD
ncbi:MAG: Regulator of sigma-E protease RseP [Verrucomicrobiota bacterium]